MIDYVERRKVWEMLHDIGGCSADPDSWADGWDKAIDTAIDELEKLPAADADTLVEVHGHWIRPCTQDRSYKWKCSVCGEIANYIPHGSRKGRVSKCRLKYCPNCGAKMEWGNDNA
ncbi:MAG: hypothetical protein NC078_01760 [Ruminococcus sp.]|nr:hypothetical protein [Ruminococcus sp.]